MVMTEFEKFPLFNVSTMGMLKKNTRQNPEILIDLFKSFIEDSQELIKNLNSKDQTEDFSAFYTSVHTLKGLSGTIGCTRMFEVLKLMDSLNKENDFDQSKSYLDVLQVVFTQTCSGIETEIFS
jgi:HPt (histidine-containing phosphotransfer) domain-containing protein